MIAIVSLNLPFLGPFDYLVPPELADQLVRGARLLVPFGPTERVGWLLGLAEESAVKGLKPILAIVEADPLFSPEQLDFLEWTAEYYACKPAEVFEAAIPAALKPKIKRQLNLKELPEGLQEEERAYLAQAQGSDPQNLKRKAKGQPLGELIKRGLSEGWAQVDYRIEVPLEAGTPWFKWLQRPESPAKRSKMAQVVEALGELEEFSLAQLERVVAKPASLIKKAVQEGNLQRLIKPLELPLNIQRNKFLPLSPEQQICQDALKEGMGTFGAFLLKGVTGSGKTEVYLQIAADVLEAGKNVLILLPEISLTPQAIRRFTERFGQSIAVLHSQMADGQRAQEWLKIKKGRVSVVIGARSAIFAPLKNLGLIVVDEEHDHSYKQQESPAYNARDLALKLGQDHQALVVLGSATPSVESYHNAQSGKYHLLELTKRITGTDPPKLQVIDLKEARRVKGVFYLSSQLYERLVENHEAGRQAILFLNRRGYAACLSCKACEAPVLCPRCDVAMTWHQGKGQLHCHHCGERSFYPKICKLCGETKFGLEGIGTERIERDLRILFPQARFIRIDRDTVTKRGSLEAAIAQVEAGEVDFLIGTQMIAKGHDFQHVGLVAVLFADLGLNIPDFRSSERGFQLFAQVSGRAGRGEGKLGEAWLQTYNPQHEAILAAVNQDYEGFYAFEAERRATLGMPPFSRWIQLRISDANAAKAAEGAQALGEILRDYQSSLGFEMMGPEPAPITKIADRYYWHLLFSTSRPKALKQLLLRVLPDRTSYDLKSSARISLDVDPYLFL
ncbi:MAG: primosomal protein N' [bacterium]|nr:primosomal protein N' [bacterium]